MMALILSPPPQLVPLLPFLLLLLLLLAFFPSAQSDDDVAALLKFKSSITGAAADDFSTWAADAKPPCSGNNSNWAHIRCSGGSVWSIQLKDMAITGHPDLDSLSTIQSLRALSLVNNRFQGNLPHINKLTTLRSTSLSYNNFSGEMPDDAFNGMMSLKKLHLNHNAFTGKIPASLIDLPKLLELHLEGNKLSGQIPNFQQKLQVLDVSNNVLEGPIPSSLAKMNASYFSGNKGLCGPPLTATTQYCQLATTSSSSSTSLAVGTHRDDKKTMSTSKAAIIAGVVVAGVLISVVLIVLCLRKRAIDATPTPSHLRRKASFTELENPASSNGSPAHTNNYGKKGGVEAAAAMMTLTFVKEGTAKFDLQDLLKASAEILGSGCFGASYKAALLTTDGKEGNVMVVKRFRQMNNVGREEFQEHMKRLGRLSHPNLLPLVAYYYRNEEKLLVSEYVSRGSLALHLHSNGGKVATNKGDRHQQHLDWPMRLRVVKGVARGLVYLYNSLPSLIAPHGHLKSSNVLLNDSYEPLLHDYGLTPVINQEISQDLMVAYKSPEYLQHTRINKKTDVWSLGVLILEILTGRFPSNFLQPSSSSSSSNQDQDLASWVRSVGASNQVFDKDMRAPGTHYDNDIINLLNIGLACCEPDVDKRFDINEAADKIEEMKEPDDDFFSLCASEADFRSTRALSDDFSAPKYIK